MSSRGGSSPRGNASIEELDNAGVGVFDKNGAVGCEPVIQETWTGPTVGIW